MRTSSGLLLSGVRLASGQAADVLIQGGAIAPEAAYHAVSAAARAVMGLPEVQIQSGCPAELLAIRAASLREAVARAPADRVVIHQGRVVSRTRIVHELLPIEGSVGGRELPAGSTGSSR